MRSWTARPRRRPREPCTERQARRSCRPAPRRRQTAGPFSTQQSQRGGTGGGAGLPRARPYSASFA
eukprot:5153782-Lingulodinium_polyedra.AAC.1